MLRDVTAGLHDLADALRQVKLPEHVEHVHTLSVQPSGWFLLGLVLGALVVWVWVIRWK